MAENVYRSQVGAENRKYPRVKLKLWVKYKRLKKGEVSSPNETLAEDFGTQGIAMRSKTPMRMGQLLMLTLYLPPEPKRSLEAEPAAVPEKDCVPVDILSRVAWCAPRSEDEYMLGVQFLDPDPGHRNRLKSFLVDFNLDRPDSALYS
jgi:c-di-GMP-binding flagellar brake protein YcgR